MKMSKETKAKLNEIIGNLAYNFGKLLGKLF